MNQQDVANEITLMTGEEISKFTISNYENGSRKVPMNLITVFARLFKVSTDRLLFEGEDFPEAAQDIRSLQIQLKNANDLINELKQENLQLKQSRDQLQRKIDKILKSLS